MKIPMILSKTLLCTAFILGAPEMCAAKKLANIDKYCQKITDADIQRHIHALDTGEETPLLLQGTTSTGRASSQGAGDISHDLYVGSIFKRVSPGKIGTGLTFSKSVPDSSDPRDMYAPAPKTGMCIYTDSTGAEVTFQMSSITDYDKKMGKPENQPCVYFGNKNYNVASAIADGSNAKDYRLSDKDGKEWEMVEPPKGDAFDGLDVLTFKKKEMDPDGKSLKCYYGYGQGKEVSIKLIASQKH